MSERVHIIVEEGVADVRLARPNKLNACDADMFVGIVNAIARIAEMREVRAVVLSGEGRAFCVGADMANIATGGLIADPVRRTHGIANLVQQAAYGWRTLPQPVIAAVHGYAFGAGLQIMLGADIRIAKPDAQLAAMEVRWGLVPDMGALAMLRGVVRDDQAREIVYTGRRVTGEEGAKIGLVTRTDDAPHQEAMRLARMIAENSPDAVRAAKRLFAIQADEDTATLLLAESREQRVLRASANHRETLAAARAQRLPRFVDLENPD